MSEYDPKEIHWNSKTDSFKIRTSRLNGREIKESNRYLDTQQKEKLGSKFKSEDDYYCDHCDRTQKVLKLEWAKMNIDRELKGLSPLSRTRPFLVVNELHGKGLHFLEKIKNKVIQTPFKNINRLCFSCNNKYHSNEQEIDASKGDLPKVVILSRNTKISYWDMVDNVLETDSHVCFKGTLNGYAKILNVMQDTLENYFKQKYPNDWGLVDIVKYGIDCENPHCDGQHIIDPMNKPVYIPTNKEARLQEEADDLAEKESSQNDHS